MVSENVGFGQLMLRKAYKLGFNEEDLPDMSGFHIHDLASERNMDSILGRENGVTKVFQR